MRSRSVLARLRDDSRGITVVEFAIVAPVMCLLIVGGLDVGHTLYMRTNLEGVMQTAARASALESGINATNRQVIDDLVRAEVRKLHNGATVTFDRDFFSTYEQAERRYEPWTDSETPGDGRCNNGEPYIDENGNGSWDSELGQSGQGGAKDAVIYRATVSYPAMLPLWRFINGSDQVTIEATTVLRNQPYGEQARSTPRQRNCSI